MSDLSQNSFEPDHADGPSDPTASMAAEMLQALPVGVIAWSRDNRCLYVNRSALSLLDLSAETLKTGIKLVDFLKAEGERGVFRSDQMQDISDKINMRKPFSFTYNLPAGDTPLAHVQPVRSGGVIMTLTDQSTAQKAIATANDAKAVAEAAQVAATGVLEEERERRRTQDLISQMDDWLQACKSLKELYLILQAFLAHAIPDTNGQLFVYANSRDVLELACSWNCATPPDHITPDSCWALRRGRRYTSKPDVFGFPCDHITDSLGDGTDDLAYTCVPVIAHGETVGLLHVEAEPGSPERTLSQRFEFAKICAEHISIAIANVQLRDALQDQSTRDPLTGLYNRRQFLDSMRREITRAAQSETSFALVSFDADHFKSFNDKYGHDAGDAVLEGIADKMRELEYPGAVPCRVGGEEFAIILPGADRTRATKAAEDFRDSIEQMRVKYIGGPLPKVTVSLGIAIYPTHGTEPMDLIKQADLALYEAKDAGRNCWRLKDDLELVTF